MASTRVAASIQRSYLMATLERTGSSLLADAITRTGVAGDPEEWFGYSKLRVLASGLQNVSGDSHRDSPGIASFRSYVSEIAAKRASFNGVFGVKVHWFQFERLLAEGWVRTPEDLFPPDAPLTTRSVISLTRDDVRRQAISIYRAEQTGVYVLHEDGRASMSRHGLPVWEPEPSDETFRELDYILGSIRRHEQAWDAWFSITDIPVLRLRYEDLVTQYQASVRRAIVHVTGSDEPLADVPEPRLAVQRDASTEELLSCWPTTDTAQVAADAGMSQQIPEVA
jgi:LPS sulfotransferase NodH